MHPRHSFAALVAALALLITGCFRADVSLTVKADGTGELRVIQAVDVDRLGRLPQGFQLDDGLLLPSAGELPSGVTAKPYVSGTFEGTELLARFRSPQQLSRQLDDLDGLSAGLAQRSGLGLLRPFAGITIEQTAGGWHFAAPTPDLSDLADLPFGALSGSNAPTIRVEVTLPGSALDAAHNADKVDGGRFVWNVGIDDRRSSLEAYTQVRSLGASSDNLPWAILGTALVIVGLAALGFALDSRQRARRAARSATGTATTGPPLDGGGWPIRPPEGPTFPASSGPVPSPGPSAPTLPTPPTLPTSPPIAPPPTGEPAIPAPPRPLPAPTVNPATATPSFPSFPPFPDLSSRSSAPAPPATSNPLATPTETATAPPEPASEMALPALPPQRPADLADPPRPANGG